MCEKFTKKEMVTGELIKFTQCLGNKPLTNDQKAFLLVQMGKLISPQESIHFAWSQAECQASWKVNKLLQTFYGMPIARLEPWRKIYPHIAVSVLSSPQPAADPSDPGWNGWELCFLLSDVCVTIVRSTTHQHKVFAPRFQLLPPSL